MSEVARSNSEMLTLVHQRAAAIRRRRRRRIVVSIEATIAVALVGIAVVVLRRPDGPRVVVPGSSSTTQASVAETTPPSTASATVPSTVPVSPPADQRVVEPIGAVGGPFAIRVSSTSIESVPLSGDAGQEVLRYQLRIGYDSGGRSGTVTSNATTDDGQFGVALGCRPGCAFSASDLSVVDTDVVVTARATTVSDGPHRLLMSVNLDDGTVYPFSVVYVVNALAGDAEARLITESRGAPTEVQNVVGVGGFAYHLTAAFGSMWIVGKSSETLTRVDARTGQIQATIRLSAGQTNRITATDEAVYVSGDPVTRIDPTDNSATTIDIPDHSLAVIGAHEQVWAAGFGGVERIDADGTVTSLDLPKANWVDLAISNGLVWVVSQVRETGRVIAFDGQTGDVRYDIPITEGEPDSAAVRLVADKLSVVVGIDTSGLGGRTGELVVIDPRQGSISQRLTLDSRPEGIALTEHHIWTNAAVLDRATGAVTAQVFGFSIALGPDGSLWGTRQVLLEGSGWIDIGQVVRYAPGDFAG